MREQENFVRIGDHRDIPMALGLVVMAWNSCEQRLRDMLRMMACGGHMENYRLAEVLIVELKSLGIVQGLQCYADEFPDEALDLGETIRYVSLYYETCRAYRNHYVHGIGGVTKYGFDFTEAVLNDDKPFYESMTVGPFGQIYSKSAKGKSRFVFTHITIEELSGFNNTLADFIDYCDNVQASLGAYFNDEIDDFRKIAPLPERMPPLKTLVKPVLDHPKLKRRPALARRALIDPAED